MGETTTKKRKADALGRVSASIASNDVEADRSGDKSSAPSCSGRGRVSGWTTCPLCGRFSTKRYALGRGIASHLHAVHTPWKPGKVEQKKRRRMAEQQNRRHETPVLSTDNDRAEPLETFQPTQKDIVEWDAQVLKIVAEIEEIAYRVDGEPSSSDASTVQIVRPGLGRDGKDAQNYSESLPPFLSAAARGDLEQLRAMVQQAEDEGKSKNGDDAANVNRKSCIMELLETRDRHLSCADHWAAGGGHLECLQYLLQLRRDYAIEKMEGRKTRRRDGKTCLHYAARNGHLHCVKFLIEHQKHAVDDVSGDETTPFHMACFGGHVAVAKYLIEQGANVQLANNWGCGAAHWIGMTKNKSDTDIHQLCRMLQSLGVSFVAPQNQGHTPLHKAAQKLNRHVIEFLARSASEGGAGLTDEQKCQAGLPDMGGHRASEIWLSVGGEKEFGQTMKDEWSW